MRNILAVTFALVMFAGVACQATNPSQTTSAAVVTANSSSTQTALLPSEGSPIPSCQPGHCPPPGMQPQLMANEGSSGLALSTNWVTL